MRTVPLLRWRPRTVDVLIAVTVVVVAVAIVVNGVSEVRTHHRNVREIATFKRFIAVNMGSKGFGRPRVRFYAKHDIVCGTHRGPSYKLCLFVTAETGRFLRAYKIIDSPAGKRRVPVIPRQSGTASAAPRSTRTS